MSYEICGMGCNAYLHTSPNGVNWGDPASPGQRIESAQGHYFALAPTVSWAPQDGNPQGRLLLNNADNAVAPPTAR